MKKFVDTFEKTSLVLIGLMISAFISVSGYKTLIYYGTVKPMVTEVEVFILITTMIFLIASVILIIVGMVSLFIIIWT